MRTWCTSPGCSCTWTLPSTPSSTTLCQQSTGRHSKKPSSIPQLVAGEFLWILYLCYIIPVFFLKYWYKWIYSQQYYCKWEEFYHSALHWCCIMYKYAEIFLLNFWYENKINLSLLILFRLFKETGVAVAVGRPSMKTEVTQFSLSKDNLKSLRQQRSNTSSMMNDHV